MAIEAGRVLAERYRLIRPVGQGSQASVWVAEHLALTTHVAVKLIDQELAKKESARERFRREATAAAQLRSAHVVQILDHGIDGDQPFIVMELLDGEDLFERLAHRNRLSLRETSKIVTQVARALSRAHAAGIVHRDLKPENVFLCPNEDDEVVKVLDFGVAKVKDAAKVTMQKTGVGTLIGTPHYMSPEQVKGIGEIDYHADLWALGVIAFQCVTGELPFDSEGVGDLLIKITIGDAPIPSKVYPGVPPNFDQWFAKACARDPAKRFQSAREMAVALAGVVGVIDGATPRPTMRPPADGAGNALLERPARAATEHLEADDWEEIDEYDEVAQHAPAAARAPAAASPAPHVAVPAPKIPRPAAGERPHSNAPPPKPPASSPAAVSAASPEAPGLVGGPAQAPRPPAPPVAAEAQDIVDFDETIPAHDIALPLVVKAQQAAWEARAASERPRSPTPHTPHTADPSAPTPPVESLPERIVIKPPVTPADDAHAPWDAANGARPIWEAKERPQEQALIAPVVMPPRAAEPGPPSAPRPPPSSRNAGAASARSAHPTGVPVVTPVDPPARPVLVPDTFEFDGSSKRRRLVRFMVAGLVIAAVGITWTVVRSQLDLSFGAGVPTPSATAVAAPPPPPPEPAPAPTPTPTASVTAIDPGKVTHPSKPMTATPMVHRPAPTALPKPKPKPPNDGTIVIPDPPADDGN